LFIFGKIKTLGISSRFSGLCIQFAEGAWERGGRFLRENNTASLKHLKGYETITLDPGSSENQSLKKKGHI